MPNFASIGRVEIVYTLGHLKINFTSRPISPNPLPYFLELCNGIDLIFFSLIGYLLLNFQIASSLSIFKLKLVALCLEKFFQSKEKYAQYKI